MNLEGQLTEKNLEIWTIELASRHEQTEQLMTLVRPEAEDCAFTVYQQSLVYGLCYYWETLLS